MQATAVLVMFTLLSSGCCSMILKREVNLLDLLRTPLLLSFNRNNAFVPNSGEDVQKDYIQRLLGIRRAQRRREPTMD